MKVSRIRDLVAEEYELSVRAMMSRRRPAEIARPRQLAMWLCREYTNLSYPQIGLFFDRDHTTVMHACKVVPQLMEMDPEFRKIAVKLKQRCEGKWYPPGQEEYIMGIWA